MLYMYSSFWLLGVESRDFSHAEKERTACKAGLKTQKMDILSVFELISDSLTAT